MLLKGFLSVFFLSVCTLDTHRLSHYSKLDFLLRIYSVLPARNKIPNRTEISAMTEIKKTGTKEVSVRITLVKRKTFFYLRLFIFGCKAVLCLEQQKDPHTEQRRH